MINTSNKKLTDNKTEAIYKEKKIKIFKNLFKLLDSDQDGEISIFCIDFRKLSVNMKKLIQPMTYQMKEWGVKYIEEEFIIECEKLYNVNNIVYLEYELRE